MNCVLAARRKIQPWGPSECNFFIVISIWLPCIILCKIIMQGFTNSSMLFCKNFSACTIQFCCKYEPTVFPHEFPCWYIDEKLYIIYQHNLYRKACRHFMLCLNVSRCKMALLLQSQFDHLFNPQDCDNSKLICCVRLSGLSYKTDARNEYSAKLAGWIPKSAVCFGFESDSAVNTIFLQLIHWNKAKLNTELCHKIKHISRSSFLMKTQCRTEM